MKEEQIITVTMPYKMKDGTMRVILSDTTRSRAEIEQLHDENKKRVEQGLEPLAPGDKLITGHLS